MAPSGSTSKAGTPVRAARSRSCGSRGSSGVSPTSSRSARNRRNPRDCNDARGRTRGYLTQRTRKHACSGGGQCLAGAVEALKRRPQVGAGWTRERTTSVIPAPTQAPARTTGALITSAPVDLVSRSSRKSGRIARGRAVARLTRNRGSGLVRVRARIHASAPTNPSVITARTS